MATITPTVAKVGNDGVNNVYIASWLAIGDADTCTAVQMCGAADRSVQVTGTFGGATIIIQGSNDGTNYVTLTDPQGNAISKSSAALEQIEELTRYIKPSSSGGSGSSTNVYILLKGQY